MYTNENINGIIFLYHGDSYVVSNVGEKYCRLTCQNKDWNDDDYLVKDLLKHLNDGTYRLPSIIDNYSIF